MADGFVLEIPEMVGIALSPQRKGKFKSNGRMDTNWTKRAVNAKECGQVREPALATGFVEFDLSNGGRAARPAGMISVDAVDCRHRAVGDGANQRPRGFHRQPRDPGVADDKRRRLDRAQQLLAAA